MDIKKIISTYKTQAILVLTAVVITLVCVLLLPGILGNNKPDFAVIAKSSLEEIIEISDLSTIEYKYNSIATITNEKGKEKYYVRYGGTVKAGINFENIVIEDIKKENKLLVTLPPVEVREPNVEPESLEFIFIKDKYETETVFMEALAAAKSDLATKSAEEDMNGLAYENARTMIEALLEPWLSQLDAEYTLEVV